MIACGVPVPGLSCPRTAPIRARSPRGTRTGAIGEPSAEVTMNEDVFNMEVRKFLKKVGVTSQREIENAVRAALADA